MIKSFLTAWLFLSISIAALAVVHGLSTQALADDSASAALPAPSHATDADSAKPKKPGAKTGSSNQLDFSESVVEGMNLNSKDSLETVSKRDANKHQHLYGKRQDFKPEIHALGRDIGDLP